MPKRRYSRKRRPRKRRRRMARRRRIPVLLGNQKLVSHKFTDATQLLVDSVAGLSIVKTYRANCISQPNPSTPDQVNGFAEMSALFQNSCVVGSRITLTCLPSQNQHARAFYIATELINRLGQPSFDLDQILAQRFVRSTVYSPGDGGGWRPKITAKFSPRKYFGLRDLRDNDQISAIGEAIPELEAYFNVSQSPTHSTALQTCDIIVQIQYAVLWTHPRTPAFT